MIYDLVKKQGDRDGNIKALASSMRDMLASLSEIQDLEKIKILHSVIRDAMTRIRECAEFVNAYAQHGFWGRLVRQSLSSHTVDTIKRLQDDFGQLKEKFNNAVSIQTLKTVAESHQLVGVLKDDLRDIKVIFVAQADRADEERLDKLPRSKEAAYDWSLQCLSGTRQTILRQIYDWIDNKEPGRNVFWLRGTAGSGKSTIASTVAAQLDNGDSGLRQLGLGSLGATFFCKRDLITCAAGLFIWTKLSFEFMYRHPSPSKALDLVLKPTGQSYLDELYRTVLTQGLDPEVLPMLHEFCETHVIHWLEVMSLKAETRNAIMAVQKLRKWLPPDDPSIHILQDLTRFCASFAYVIAQSAPHIYISAAILTPQESHASEIGYSTILRTCCAILTPNYGLLPSISRMSSDIHYMHKSTFPTIILCAPRRLQQMKAW